MPYSADLIDAARRCLEHQIHRWDAEREIECLLDRELEDTEEGIKHFCVCLDLDEEGRAPESAAIALLDVFTGKVEVEKNPPAQGDPRIIWASVQRKRILLNQG